VNQLDNKIQKLLVKEQYDSTVEVYDDIRFGSLGGKYFDKVEKSYVTRFLKGIKVLHIGTATGRFTELLTMKNYHYVGIEISKEMTKTSRKRIHNSKSEVVHADGENLPIIGSLFDNVLCVRSFQFLPDPKRFLSEAYRVLEGDGRVIVSFEMFLSIRPLLEKLSLLPLSPPPRTYCRIIDVVALVRRAGFEILWFGKVTRLPLLIYWRSPRFMSKILTVIHDYLPFWFGTVGLVVGRKESK